MKRCQHCNGTGARLFMGVPYSCDKCNGKGHAGRPWWHYVGMAFAIIFLINLATCAGCAVCMSMGHQKARAYER